MNFIINFEITLVNFFNILGFCFLLLKKRRLYVSNLLSSSDQCLLLCRFIAFSMIMVHGYCSWNIFNELLKCLRFLKGSFHAFLQFPSHIQENLEEKHTLPCFSLKNHGQSFFLNHLFLQFNSRINRGFCFCKWSPCEDICGILLCKNEFYKNIYLPKYIFHKKFIPLRCYKDLNKLHCNIGKRVQCILFIKCISTF